MKPSVLGGLLGALAGFVGVLLSYMLTISSSLASALLFPGRVFVRASNGMGPFGHMVFYTFAYFSSMLLYAAVGFTIGLLFTRNRKQEGSKP